MSAERKAELIGQYQAKLAYVVRNYRSVSDLERALPSFNESLARLARVTNPRSRRRDLHGRLHPLIELTINERARKVMGALTLEAITHAARKVASSVRPFRGRPANAALVYHVQALMALWHDMTGIVVTASKTKNSVYEPSLTSPGAQMIEQVLQGIDATITRTAISNIIIHANATEAVSDKSFADFFPFYGDSIDPESGIPVPGPGYRLVSYDPADPIYCS